MTCVVLRGDESDCDEWGNAPLVTKGYRVAAYYITDDGMLAMHDAESHVSTYLPRGEWIDLKVENDSLDNFLGCVLGKDGSEE